MTTTDPTVKADVSEAGAAKQVLRGAGGLAWPGRLRMLDRKDATYRD